jgi:hypothetical protein
MIRQVGIPADYLTPGDIIRTMTPFQPRSLRATGVVIAVILLAAQRPAQAQQAQNPSPMVEHTRAHPRLTEQSPPGRRVPLELGTLFVPEHLKIQPGQKKPVPLAVMFHGGTWLPEAAAMRLRTAVITIQLGAGSGSYASALADAGRFDAILSAAEQKVGVRFQPITLAGWSAGCGAIRELLKQPASMNRVDRIVAIDGIHTDYLGGAPGPVESQLETTKLQGWLRFARDAMAGRRRLLITHTEIFPGTYASTTETSDWLIRELGLRRHAVLEWGPMGTQRVSDTRAGRLRIQGYAGNTAPDHVDQLQALVDWLRLVE